MHKDTLAKIDLAIKNRRNAYHRAPLALRLKAFKNFKAYYGDAETAYCRMTCQNGMI